MRPTDIERRTEVDVKMKQIRQKMVTEVRESDTKYYLDNMSKNLPRRVIKYMFSYYNKRTRNEVGYILKMR